MYGRCGYYAQHCFKTFLVDTTFIAVLSIIILAFAFDFINGFHDSANAIATVVSTRVLSPQSAVIMAAFFNFAAFLVFGVAVAATIAKGVVDPDAVNRSVIFSALVGAIVWDLITWRAALPTSSSHALIGGLLGAAYVKGGVKMLIFGGINKILLFMFISPILGLVLAYVFMMVVTRLFYKVDAKKMNFVFRKLQLLSAAFYSLSHGTNDAQKTMGVVAVLLYSAGYLGNKLYVPLWVVLMAHTAIALGTLFGGWRIVKTMGKKMANLRPVHGFSAETASGLVLFGSAHFGIPVSTTHAISGSILGVGMAQRATGVRWILARKILGAWILTIPASAAVAGVTYLVLKLIFP